MAAYRGLDTADATEKDLSITLNNFAKETCTGLIRETHTERTFQKETNKAAAASSKQAS